MLRRRMGRRFRRASGTEVPPALGEANQLMRAGKYAEAAAIFEQFAGVAVTRHGPRAPWFLLQAAQAWIGAGEMQKGMAHLQQGLTILAGRGQFQRLANAGMRFVTELRKGGHGKEAETIERYLVSVLPAGFIARAEPVMQMVKRSLPTNCRGCGAPLRSDEVEWVDERTVECPYCSTAVRAE